MRRELLGASSAVRVVTRTRCAALDANAHLVVDLALRGLDDERSTRPVGRVICSTAPSERSVRAGVADGWSGLVPMRSVNSSRERAVVITEGRRNPCGDEGCACTRHVSLEHRADLRDGRRDSSMMSRKSTKGVVQRVRGVPGRARRCGE